MSSDDVSQASACCDLHGRNCEPPSELCCDRCTEVHHGMHTDPPHSKLRASHHDGSVCSNPDLSGFGVFQASEPRDWRNAFPGGSVCRYCGVSADEHQPPVSQASDEAAVERLCPPRLVEWLEGEDKRHRGRMTYDAIVYSILAALTVADIPASLVAAIRADERAKVSADIEAMSLADDFNHPYVPSDIRARAARLAAGVSQ